MTLVDLPVAGEAIKQKFLTNRIGKSCLGSEVASNECNAIETIQVHDNLKYILGIFILQLHMTSNMTHSTKYLNNIDT